VEALRAGGHDAAVIGRVIGEGDGQIVVNGHALR
jgi:hypothetical protein